MEFLGENVEEQDKSSDIEKQPPLGRSLIKQYTAKIRFISPVKAFLFSKLNQISEIWKVLTFTPYPSNL